MTVTLSNHVAPRSVL